MLSLKNGNQCMRGWSHESLDVGISSSLPSPHSMPWSWVLYYFWGKGSGESWPNPQLMGIHVNVWGGGATKALMWPQTPPTCTPNHTLPVCLEVSSTPVKTRVVCDDNHTHREVYMWPGYDINIGLGTLSTFNQVGANFGAYFLYSFPRV